MVLLLPTEPPPLAVVVLNRFAVVIVLLFVTPLGLIGLEISKGVKKKKILKRCTWKMKLNQQINAKFRT